MENEKVYLNNPLVKKFKEYEAKDYKGNYFLYAGGGYGKTTAMQCLFLYLRDEAIKGEKIAPLYIDVKQIDYSENKPIINYIYSVYSGEDTSIEDVKNLFSDQAPAFLKKYKYYILIDGYNEANEDAKSNINSDIRALMVQKNVKLIVSSRISEQANIFSDFKRLSLLGLNDEQIEKYLNHEFAKFRENANAKKINKSLIEILRIPLFMYAFSQTYNKKSPYPDLYEEKAVRKADILDSFIWHTLKKLKKEENINDLLVEFILMYFLPTIAFNMVKNSVFIIADKDFTAIRDNVNYFEKLLSTKQQGIYLKNYVLNKYDIEKICCDNITLLNRTGEGYTLHQIWRDFFAAKHIINCMNAELLDELEISVDENIRQYVGELIREYDNDYKYSKKPEFKVVYKDGEKIIESKKDTRRCECDFEEKDNSEKPYSPIEHFMQMNHSALSDERQMAIRNLIEIMKTCRNKHITARYDNLNLKMVDYYFCTLSKSSFKKSQIYKDNFIQQGHTDVVNSVAFSPDGKKIVSGSDDLTIRLWDTETKKQIGHPLKGHKMFVYSALFSPIKNEIVSSSRDSRIRLWDSNGKPIKWLIDHTGSVNSVSISQDGKKIISGSADNTIWLWDMETRSKIGESLKGHTGAVNSVAFSPDGQKIISGSDDKTIRLWDVKSRKQIGESLEGHTAPINSVMFSPDGQKIISGSDDKTIRLWDVKSRRQISKSLEGHTGSVNSVAFSPDGLEIVSGSRDSTIRIWNTKTMTPIGEPMEGHTGPVNSIAYSPDGKKIVSGSFDESIQIWDAKSRRLIGYPISRYSVFAKSASISYDGKIIAGGNADGTIRIWDAETGRQIGNPFEDHTDVVNSLFFSHDGKKLVSGSNDKTIRIWDVETEQPICNPLIGHVGKVNSVGFSPDGKTIVSGSNDKSVRIWNVESGKEIIKLFGHTGVINAVAFSPDGKIIASGSSGRTIRLWDVMTGKQIGSPLVGHISSINCIAFSLDGQRIVSGSSDRTIRIWDVKTRKQVKIIKGHMDDITSVRFMPDGKIVSGSWDETICIWDSITGTLISKLISSKNGVGGILTLSTSVDGKRIVFGGADGTICALDYINKTQFVMQPISAIVQDCHFESANYNQPDSNDFYRILYTNGAKVPKMYEPRPMPIDNAETE